MFDRATTVNPGFIWLVLLDLKDKAVCCELIYAFQHIIWSQTCS